MKTGIENENWSSQDEDCKSCEEVLNENDKGRGERITKAKGLEEREPEIQECLVKKTMKNAAVEEPRSSAKFGIEVSEKNNSEICDTLEDNIENIGGDLSQSRGSVTSEGYGLELSQRRELESSRTYEDGAARFEDEIDNIGGARRKLRGTVASGGYGLELSQRRELESSRTYEGGAARFEDENDNIGGARRKLRGTVASGGYGLELSQRRELELSRLSEGGATRDWENDSTVVNPPSESFIRSFGNKVQAAISDIADEQKKGNERLQNAVKAVGEGIRIEKGEINDMLNRIQVLQAKHVDTPRRSERLEKKRLGKQNDSAEYEWDYN